MVDVLDHVADLLGLTDVLPERLDVPVCVLVPDIVDDLEVVPLLVVV